MHNTACHLLHTLPSLAGTTKIPRDNIESRKDLGGKHTKKEEKRSSLPWECSLIVNTDKILPTVPQMWPKPKLRQTWTFLIDLWRNSQCLAKPHMKGNTGVSRLVRVSDSTKAPAQEKADSLSAENHLEEKMLRTVNKLTLYIDKQKYPTSNDSNIWIIAL